MIHQFVELGRYYHRKAGIGSDEEGRLRQYAQDPSQKFKTRTVLVLRFAEIGFIGLQTEEYDESKRLRYLYRFGSPSGGDITPTTGMRIGPAPSAVFYESARTEFLKKLGRIRGAIKTAVAFLTSSPHVGDQPELQALESMYEALRSDSSSGIFDALLAMFPPEEKGLRKILPPAILTIAWSSSKGDEYVGAFPTFRHLVLDAGQKSASMMTSISTVPIRGQATCSVCGTGAEVAGASRIAQFKFYSIDDAGNVSGGFDRSRAWRNFPVCDECAQMSEFAGEPVKANLTFPYYGKLRYTVLPSPIIGKPTEIYDTLDRLVGARITASAQKRLTDVEDELFYTISKESNRLQIDLLFFEPDPQSFQPALYVSGLLPSRFAEIFQVKDRVDSHAWHSQPSPQAFQQEFTFGSLYEILRDSQRAFLAATRAALELRAFDRSVLMQFGMRKVCEDHRQSQDWRIPLAELFRSLEFFDCLLGVEMNMTSDVVDYGDTEQADRVRALFREAGDRLRGSAGAQAAFLVGACCSRIEVIQQHQRGASPFAAKLKGFRLTKADIDGLFIAAKEKAAAYGLEEEKKVSGLLECAAAALMKADTGFSRLSNDEISYFVALGHALRPRLAK